MISKRNYFSITMLMLVVLFLFQFTNVARDMWNDYDTNRFATDRNSLASRSEAFDSAHAAEIPGRDLVACLGGRSGLVERVARAWAGYSKRGYAAYNSLQSFEKDSRAGGLYMLVIDPAALEWTGEEADAFSSLAESGVHLVFAGLPEPAAIEREQAWMELLGVHRVVDHGAEMQGLQVNSGFLLGGEAVYMAENQEEAWNKQDMELTMPWYVLGSGTTAYMQAIPQDQDNVEAENYPAVIWRKSSGAGYVYAVNGGYMEDAAGLGLLSAMSAMNNFYELYPVVNAQSMVAANFPGLADENQERMDEIYSQNMRGILRDLVWPDLAAVVRQNKLGISYMMAPQYDYSDENEPDSQLLAYYMRLINEQRGEAGLTAENFSGAAFTEKFEADQEFMSMNLPDFQFASLYDGAGDQKALAEMAEEEYLLRGVRTIVSPYEPGAEVLGYAGEHITCQRTLADGLHYTYMQDFRVRCLETALAYTSVLVDMGPVAYPESQEDLPWLELSGNFAKDIKEHCSGFSFFDGTTVSETDSRLRGFLAMDYTQSRQDDVITLEVTGTDYPVWFILRTNGEDVSQVEGGGYQYLEDGVFLILVESGRVQIHVKPASGYHFQFAF